MISVRGLEKALHLRELRPKDFYQIKMWADERGSETLLRTRILCMLSLRKGSLKEVLRSRPRCLSKLLLWVEKNIIEGCLMEPNAWLDMAFPLSKERWSSDLDWLELQPMSKINAMADTSNRYFERQRSKVG